MERVATALGLAQNDNRVGGGDSFVDRLSCSYTVMILAVFAALITTKQWLGEVPIACWCPAHFTDTHEDFTNNVRKLNQLSILFIYVNSFLYMYLLKI